MNAKALIELLRSLSPRRRRDEQTLAEARILATARLEEIGKEKHETAQV